MQVFSIIFERVPMVWFLLGLLFNATGLYLGFEYPLSFAYMFVGWFCCAYGIAIFVYRLTERPKSSEQRRLSPNFISAGATVIMPAMPKGDKVQTADQPAAE